MGDGLNLGKMLEMYLLYSIWSLSMCCHTGVALFEYFTDFQVNIGDIGDIYKVRLEHDNTGDFPSWHLDKLMMKDKHTSQELKFYMDRWLAEDEEDGALSRELVPVASGKAGRPGTEG